MSLLTIRADPRPLSMAIHKHGQHVPLKVDCFYFAIFSDSEDLMKSFIFVIGIAIAGSVMGVGTAVYDDSSVDPAHSSLATSPGVAEQTSMPPIVDH